MMRNWDIPDTPKILSLKDGLASDWIVGGVTAHQVDDQYRTERLTGHIGTEIRPRLLREAAVGNIGQWAQA